jgi:ribonuclease HII
MIHEKGLCGIDEVGRGPIAGPVVAAAVILPEDFPIAILADSKKLSEERREDILPVILKEAVGYGLGWVWNGDIDRLNIHHATLLAMKLAFGELSDLPSRTLVDGKFCPEIPGEKSTIVKGDGKVASIAAASILAKVARDRWMERMSWLDPRYGYEGHKGYPTKKHKAQVKIHGPSVLHRMSFRME